MTFPINNATVRQYASTADGALAMSLVHELLSFFNMQFTLSVFEPESCESVAYHTISRTALASQLGLDSINPEEPILQTLLGRMLKKDATNTKNGEPQSASKIPEKPNNIPKGVIFILKTCFNYCIWNTIWNSS